ncbi:hypothetical protein HY480_04825 [Candidatus Uhrbacteria bacterium]|nr:hypothetical protein [Candidatus Uhrbacteria bacterium]
MDVAPVEQFRSYVDRHREAVSIVELSLLPCEGTAVTIVGRKGETLASWTSQKIADEDAVRVLESRWRNIARHQLGPHCAFVVWDHRTERGIPRWP